MVSRRNRSHLRFRPGLELLENRLLPNNLLSSSSHTNPPQIQGQSSIGDTAPYQLVSGFGDAGAGLKTEDMPALADADAANSDQFLAVMAPPSGARSENDNFVQKTQAPFAQEDTEEQQPVSPDEADPLTTRRLSNGTSNAEHIQSAPPNNNANGNLQNMAGVNAGAGQGPGGSSTTNPSGGGGSTGGGTANLHLPSQTQLQQMTSGAGATN